MVSLKKSIVVTTVILVSIFSCSLFNKGNNEENDLQYNKVSYKSGDDYTNLWDEVYEFEKKGLYESALKKVNEIFDFAFNDNNSNQIIKSICYKLKYNQYLKEDDYVVAVGNLNDLIDSAEMPTKQLLHSILGEVYWSYYSANRWKYGERTNTVNFEQNDIRTWSLDKISEKISYHYLLSLKESERTKELDINSFKSILVDNYNSDELRPTLYDFLAHRALDYFKNSELELTKPAYAFELNQKELFAGTDVFLNTKVNKEDSTASKYYAYIILKDLIEFHRNVTHDTSALIDLELERLSFAREYSVLEEKEKLYLNGLEKLVGKYSDNKSYTEISYYLALFYKQRSEKYNYLLKGDKLNDLYKDDLKLAVSICKDAVSKFPNSYGAPYCNNLINDIESKSISFVNEEVVVPNEFSKGQLNVRNLSEIYLKVIKLDYDNEVEKSFKNQEERIEYYNKKESTSVWNVSISKKDDYRARTVDFLIPELTEGYYVLLASNNKDFLSKNNAVAYGFLWSSNISYIEKKTSKQDNEFLVLNRKTGFPIEGVKARAYYEEYNYNQRKYKKVHLGDYYSDKDGMFVVPSSKSNYRSIYLDFSKDKDRLNTNSSFYQSRYYGNEPKREVKSFLFTDRGIYRPGQKVYFKGLVINQFKNDAQVLAGNKVTVTFYDHNYQKIESKDLVTNEYGTVSGEFTTLNGLINGQMSLEISLSGKSYARKYFYVEEYKRPKFEVSFNPIKESFKLEQEIKIEGLAKAYAGNSIDGAEVKYRVVRTASFPWWCWYYWRYQPNSPSMEITNGQTVTDENGNFEVVFTAITDKSVNSKYSPTYNYEVIADVVDINGETQSATQYVSVGYKALNISVDVPNELNLNGKNKFLINSTNLNGEQVVSKGKILLYKFKEPRLLKQRKYEIPTDVNVDEIEHNVKLAFEPYKNEGDESSLSKDLVKEYSFDVKLNQENYLEIGNLKSLKQGRYQLEINTEDEFGTAVKEIKSFIVYDDKSKECPINEFSWIKGEKIFGEPGEKAVLLLGSKGKDVKILYEIEHQGEIVKREWLTVNSELKRIEIPVEEKHRGNFSVHFAFVKENRVYTKDITITVPFTNKQLDITFETFRNKLLPGQKETWKVNIKGKKGDKVMAEMLATMYDASLDAFASNSIYLNLYNSYYSSLSWSNRGGGFETNWSNLVAIDWNPKREKTIYKSYPQLNKFGANFGGSSYYYSRTEYDDGVTVVTKSIQLLNKEEASEESRGSVPPLVPTKSISANKSSYAELGDEIIASGLNDKEDNEQQNSPSKPNLAGVKARTNFNETAFFLPHLTTNSNGDISFTFEMPEALTKWKFQGLAHTKDMRIGSIQKEIITQKDLMVVPNVPRFLREGDEITISAKISNISEKLLQGKAQLFLFDALTMESIDVKLSNIGSQKDFTAKSKQSTSVSWKLKVPFGIEAVKYKIVAQAGNFTDGEENALPILTNRMLVTESMPLPVKKVGIKVFEFDKLLQSGSSTSLKNHKLTLEYTSNPSWYVVQAMPYMMEYPYECAEQTFTRFYANSLATHIMNGNPKIKQIVEDWKNNSPEEFLSNLEKNEELKSLLLQETPWVLEAKDESKRKQRIAQLFDLNKMSNELDKNLTKLQKMQVSNGAWPWFKGMQESRYITQHIVTGMGHLDRLGVKNVREDNATWNMVKKAINYLDTRIAEDFKEIKKYDKDWKTNKHLSNIQIQYLYARSFFKDVKIPNNTIEANDYFLTQSQKYWLDYNVYTQGMIALGNYRLDNKSVVAKDITASLKERAIKHEELGWYWKGMMDGGYYWYQAPIETQALMIELFEDVANDQEAVEELKVWLLKQKQTTDWKTTKATAEACYALLLNGTDLLANDDKVDVTVGKYHVDYSGVTSTNKYTKTVKTDAGTGYFKTSWDGSEVTPDMGTVKVQKQKDGVAWGAVYWQYFEDLDKITPHETPLKLEKKLFIEKNTDRGVVLDPVTSSNKLKIGDKLVVRIELRVDRNMEYVHMKDMRASGFEPINVISRYKWQDGLGYYESTKDASTNFFFDYLPRGTYVFEYPLRVSQEGNFSNGITTIQCMYAPEFTSHSEGIRVEVGK